MEKVVSSERSMTAGRTFGRAAAHRCAAHSAKLLALARQEWTTFRRRAGQRMFLCRRAPNVFGAGTLRPLTDIELDAVALSKILEPLAIDGALMEEVFLARVVLDEPEALVHSQRANFSGHCSSA